MIIARKPPRQSATQKHATELLEVSGIRPDSAKVNALSAMSTPAERTALIESWKPQADRRPARSGSTRYPADRKTLLESIQPLSAIARNVAGLVR